MERIGERRKEKGDNKERGKSEREKREKRGIGDRSSRLSWQNSGNETKLTFFPLFYGLVLTGGGGGVCVCVCVNVRDCRSY